MLMDEELGDPSGAPIKESNSVRAKELLTIALLILILGVGAYLRFVGTDWDDGSHPHPDERFLTMVETGIALPTGIGDYFDTELSPLNPNNAGFSFFVYGTFPIFLVRFIAEWVSQTGYDQVHIVGRMVSASFDLASVFLVYLIGSNLYRKRVGLLAAAFAALSVLAIQHSHFFVVDPFANTFILLGIFFAIRAYKVGRWWNYALFGVSLGLATASKVNAFPLAIVAVIVVALRVWKEEDQTRIKALGKGILYLALAAGISLLMFRIFQPYAFEGPSFFGIKPNMQFFSNLIEVRRQQTGAADFPPALQWAMRIPILFSLKNLVVWGLGLPLGLISWIGFSWALWRMVRRHEFQHAILVIWTGAYFIWQSSGFTQTMRYQYPIYPTLVVLGSWGLWKAWDKISSLTHKNRRNFARVVLGASMAIVVISTAVWAFSFVNIYKEPHTQVDASRWIYRNIPGSINLVVDDSGEKHFEPGSLSVNAVLAPNAGTALDLTFKPDTWGRLNTLKLNISEDSPGLGENLIIDFALYDDLTGRNLLGSTRFEGQLNFGTLDIAFNADPQVEVYAGRQYLLRIELIEGQLLELHDQILVGMTNEDGQNHARIPLPNSFTLLNGKPLVGRIFSNSSGEVTSIYLPYLRNIDDSTSLVSLEVELFGPSNQEVSLASASYLGEISSSGDNELSLPLDRPVQIEAGVTYNLKFYLVEGVGLSFRGSRIINETTWDLGLPFSIDGRTGFSGLYVGLNQELYWPDNEDRNDDQVSDKLDRIVHTLAEGDFIAISTNRQYGTITRVPARYPLTTAYYRALFGCHWPDEVLDCAARAQPGSIQGSLGFELVSVHQSNPQFAGIEINDQLAEEAFTVYDHPKVFIFAKTSDFSEKHVRAFLSQVDLSNVDNSAPKDLTTISQNIQLFDEEFEDQKGEGTWSEIFNRDSLINRSDFLTVVIWWVAIGILGILIFPITRIVFRGLYDGGYAFSKLFGFLILSYGTWIVGNFGIAVERPVILLILVLIAFISAGIAWRDRDELKKFFIENRKTILWTEALALGFFIFDLGIRLGNPDLWHPYKGGEKPMDFSYLNAVLKSSTFPPYDPWFAGGYINYYYYGFVLIGVPIKLLGIIPSSAYNLVIPTLFSFTALGAYSIGYNLIRGRDKHRNRVGARAAGATAAVALVLLGNFGSARLMYEGFRDIGGWPGDDQASFGSGPILAVKGLAESVFGDESLNFSIDRWYWDPSRVIEPGPGEAGPITEFPFFTFLYADLHAHMINLPLTLAVLGWGISWLYSGKDGKKRGILDYSISIFMGALILGALRPTNTWDFPTYWTLAGLATLIAPFILQKKIRVQSIAESIFSTVALIGMAYLLFQPFNLWYQGSIAAESWGGSQTGMQDYLTAHGVFIILILSWLLWETRQWMSLTPISALRRVRPFVLPGIAAFFIILFGIVVLTVQGFGGAPVAFIILFWSGLLLIRRRLAFEKRIILFFIGTAAALTILVEYVVLRGDVSRMNTVFKFYFQVWTLLSLSAAAAVAWVIKSINQWSKLWRNVWFGVTGIVVFMGALYPITATPAKISDRMSESAPHSLDGMSFMESSSYYDIAGPMALDEDYRAIQWVQENVFGTPVIVEANTPEYRWGSRFSIYTGLPGVIGWNWHQRQQRGTSGDPSVVERVNEITSFYTNSSVEDALDFLDKYGVGYVIVGRLERQYYEFVKPCWPDGVGERVICDLRGRTIGMSDPDVHPTACVPVDPNDEDGDLICPTFGFEKFKVMEDLGFLQQVYRDGDTTIFEVTR